LIVTSHVTSMVIMIWL